MGRSTTIDTLSADDKAWLNAALAGSNFTGYEALSDALQARGYDISKSAVHRYGQKLERRLAAIRASTEAAKFIRDQAGDDEDARSEALIAMVQTELFDRILDFQEATDEEIDPVERIGLLSSAAKNIATLTRASYSLKRFQTEVESRAKQAAEAVSKLAHKGGLSADTVDEMRRAILGVAK
ncbi:DUF3486 family protein [Chitinimonas sp.]|uniref:DUF3486 family protein n=1 Tax=Chitinimonas sp. TaxID=1934313 RepID=UPI0035AFA2CF